MTFVNMLEQLGMARAMHTANIARNTLSLLMNMYDMVQQIVQIFRSMRTMRTKIFTIFFIQPVALGLMFLHRDGVVVFVRAHPADESIWQVHPILASLADQEMAFQVVGSSGFMSTPGADESLMTQLLMEGQMHIYVSLEVRPVIRRHETAVAVVLLLQGAPRRGRILAILTAHLHSRDHFLGIATGNNRHRLCRFDEKRYFFSNRTSIYRFLCTQSPHTRARACVFCVRVHLVKRPITARLNRYRFSPPAAYTIINRAHAHVYYCRARVFQRG